MSTQTEPLLLSMTDAGNYLKDKDRYVFIHQTGSKDAPETRAAYRRCGISCNVRAFFIDMAAVYLEADLVVCRAGATTVAEITALGKGAVFIPYPYAADDHQAKNARMLAEAGAAEMILQKDLDGKTLARRIEFYAGNRQALKAMASRAKAFGMPDAAARIVDDCYRTFTGLAGR